jgi:DNA polymerase IV
MPSSKQKIILHLDFNSYFASVEQQANPFLRGKAIAVSGKGKYSINVAQAYKHKARININQADLRRTVVTTASQQAKRLGVKTAMASQEALRICPELIMIPGDPKKYGDITKRFMVILRKHCDAVERFSTDEAFADITLAAQDYFGAAIIARMILNDIEQDIGAHCTCSIGIASNKTLAKLACESKKPSGITVVPPADAKAFIRRQELGAICGIGFKTVDRLADIGITTTTGLQKASLAELVHHFKSYGFFLFQTAHGMGDDEILEGDVAPKSIGHSYTFPHDLESEAEMKKHLLVLCDRVAWRMRKQGFLATRLSVYARYSHKGGKGAQKRFKEPMQDGLELFHNAWRILQRVRDRGYGVRLLGISASGLIKAPMPDRLFKKSQKIRSALSALDRVTERYGAGSWQRAATLGTVFKERISGWHYDHEG